MQDTHRISKAEDEKKKTKCLISVFILVACGSDNILDIQLTFEQYGFELHRSAYK